MVNLYIAIIIVIIGIFGGWIIGYTNGVRGVTDNDSIGDLVITEDDDGKYFFLSLNDDPSIIENEEFVILKVKLDRSQKSR